MQTGAVIIIIAIAVVIIGRRIHKAWKTKNGCGCGCTDCGDRWIE